MFVNIIKMFALLIFDGLNLKKQSCNWKLSIADQIFV